MPSLAVGPELIRGKPNWTLSGPSTKVTLMCQLVTFGPSHAQLIPAPVSLSLKVPPTFGSNDRIRNIRFAELPGTGIGTISVPGNGPPASGGPDGVGDVGKDDYPPEQAPANPTATIATTNLMNLITASVVSLAHGKNV